MPPDGSPHVVFDSPRYPMGLDLPPPRRRVRLEAPRSAVGEMRAFLGALIGVLALAGGLAIVLGGA